MSLLKDSLPDYEIFDNFAQQYPKAAAFRELNKRAYAFAKKIKDDKLKNMFVKCYFNTLSTTVQPQSDGSVYVITGDIDAMWLRDSSAQVMQYLDACKECADVRKLIKGLIKRQFMYIKIDPYANSFNLEANGRGHNGDECDKSPYVWERKFELDSLCYPFLLTERYAQAANDESVFDADYFRTAAVVLDTFETEQQHDAKSQYYHFRPSAPENESIPNRGRGGEVRDCGMVWSGYRPSDDPCVYQFFIPGNMMVSVVMGYVEQRALAAGKKEIAARASRLRNAVDAAIAKHGIVEKEGFGKIYAFETDGMGNHLLMDDANVPSLLAIPYIGYRGEDDEIYKNTRAFVLSRENPYYFEGAAITGIGSPHTPKGYVWAISLIMQALTTDDADTINTIVETLMRTDAGTGYMHEGIDKDCPETFTRSWFAWANSLFSYMLIQKADKIKLIEG